MMHGIWIVSARQSMRVIKFPKYEQNSNEVRQVALLGWLFPSCQP